MILPDAVLSSCHVGLKINHILRAAQFTLNKLNACWSDQSDHFPNCSSNNVKTQHFVKNTWKSRQHQGKSVFILWAKYSCHLLGAIFAFV